MKIVLLVITSVVWLVPEHLGLRLTSPYIECPLRGGREVTATPLYSLGYSVDPRYYVVVPLRFVASRKFLYIFLPYLLYRLLPVSLLQFCLFNFIVINLKAVRFTYIFMVYYIVCTNSGYFSFPLPTNER